MAKSVYARFGTSTVTGIDALQRKHTFQGGDTLPAIAASIFPDLGYNAEYWRQIAEENDIDDLDDLTAGTVLVIPPPAPSET